MTKHTQKILVIDYVPLANKGEEAIIRGIEDMFADDRETELGVFDDVKEIIRQGNITIFPVRWIFAMEVTPWTPTQRVLRKLKIALQVRFGYYSKFSRLLHSRDPKFRPLQDFLKKADQVLVGHDGAFSIESCSAAHIAKRAGKNVSILGSGNGIGRIGALYMGWIYRRCMEECDYSVFRERFTYESMKTVCSEPDKLILAPDPAFAMRPSSSEEASSLLSRYEPYALARQKGKPVVAVTVRESGIPYTLSFVECDPSQKVKIHADFVASILDTLVKERDVFLLFLPHSIEKTGDDVKAARNIVNSMSSSSDNYMILDEDLGGRLLKAIIGECDFLVGERAHSVIGSVAVATPFLALTNSRDSRTHGIIGEMCDSEDRIIDMDNPDTQQSCKKALRVFDDRDAIRQSLQKTSKELMRQLDEISNLFKGNTKD